MARANRELISALRQTAQRLAGDVSYQWGHMGMCNCGHLAQSITGLAGAEIHQSMFDLGLTGSDNRQDVVLYMNSWADLLEETVCEFVSSL